jgi:hypothetical protein
MEERPKPPKEFVERYNKLTADLKALGQEFGLSEYNLFFTKYDDESGKYQWGYHNYKIQHPSNIDAYQHKLNGLKATLFEEQRFSEFLNLKEFNVECLDDNMSQELRDIQIRQGGDWIRRGETYTVWKRGKPIGDAGGFTFFLKDREGQCLVPPFPFEGWHSSRFKVVDYTKLN